MERMEKPKCDATLLNEDWNTKWSNGKKTEYAKLWLLKNVATFDKAMTRATEGLSGWSPFGWFTKMHENHKHLTHSVGVYWIVELHPGLVAYIGFIREVETGSFRVVRHARNVVGKVCVNAQTCCGLLGVADAVTKSVAEVEGVRREWRTVRNFMADLAERSPDKPMDLLE